MSVREQLKDQLWATTNDYNEALPYLQDPAFHVTNTYHANGLFDSYYIHLR